jgi:hypothetical protein
MTRDAELRAVIGYLNFSDGAFSAKFHQALDDYFSAVRSAGGNEPWPTLIAEVNATLANWNAGGSPFGDLSRARRILELAGVEVIPAYRRFHEDLLHHLTDEELFQPFFVGRVFERTLAAAAYDPAVLEALPPSTGPAPSAFALSVVRRLNDFVGYRPMVVLENRRPQEAYPHERVAALPLYLKAVGVSKGRYFPFVTGALELLRNADPGLLNDAWLDLDVIEELALDPRAYDHQHPANQRPGYQFGEWDPHRLNERGRYARFVTRRVILRTLEKWLSTAPTSPAVPVEERVKEASAVLAGTILLASGVSGGGPGDLTSDHSPAVIVAHVSRLRDRFYADLVAKWPGPHGDRLRKEAVRDRQPFGRLRQHLNLELGRLRALQLQHDEVAKQYARIGRDEAAAAEAERVESPACRLKCRIESNFVRGERAIRAGDAATAAAAAGAAADLLRRAVQSGAVPDPWGLLAFQGHYPLFYHLPESAVDTRVEELLESVDRLFRLYARAWAGAAVAGDEKTVLRCDLESGALAEWWNQFASHEVSGLRRVHAQELHHSAQFVARVSKEWREAGAVKGDVAFWRRSADEFSAVQSYTLILEALLQAGDIVAAQALLVHWLGSGRAFDDEPSGKEFSRFGRRWLDVVLALPAEERRPLIQRFFELLEANAEELWFAPGPEIVGDSPSPPNEAPRLDDAEEEAGADDVFAAAYENVTYEDSTADGNEGSMLEAGLPGKDLDDLAQLQRTLGRRLQFLTLIAKLLQRTATVEGKKPSAEFVASLATWTSHADANRRALRRLIQSLETIAGEPSSLKPDAMAETGRRQAFRDELLDEVIACTVETAHAFHLLAAASGAALPDDVPRWEVKLVKTRAAMLRGGRDKVQRTLPDLFEALKPLVVLYLPLHLGGKPLRVAKARLGREAMKRLGEDLPKLGLFLDAFRLLEVARKAERNGLRDGRMVTEFESVFSAGLRSTLATLAGLLRRWPETKNRDDLAAANVREVVSRFTRLWSDHVAGVRISEIERRTSERAWERTRKFVKKYGGELFTQQFLQYGNLRGVLAQGVTEYLNAIQEGDEEDGPQKLLNDLGGPLGVDEAVEEISFVLQVVYSHYDLFRDYNTTTTQSDYGENIFVLLDLVRVSIAYDRDWWAMRPIQLAHRELAAAGRLGVADLLRTAFVLQMSSIADARQRDLQEVERKNGVILASVRDKINERFARPFELDRALAHLGPALSGSADSDAAFEQLRNALDQFVATPTGSGFEPPDWLRKLETEVDRLLGEADDNADGASLPRLSYSEFLQQLSEWDDDEADDE